MSQPLATPSLARYALFGLPLGFIGLPLYVHLPKYYADTLPSSLALIGFIMFVARLLDCALDPWIGYAADRWSRHRARFMAIACVTLALGVVGLFQLPRLPGATAQLVALSLLLALTYLSYSVLMIYYYAAGLALTDDAQQTTRVSAWREGAIMIGVLVASALPPLLMQRVSETQAYQCFALVFVALLAFAAGRLLRRGLPAMQAAHRAPAPWRALIQNHPLRWIFALFFLNAIPPSITATLFLFFVSDILQLAEWSGAFLVLYFISAVVAMAGWTRLGRRFGKRRSLMLAMAIAILSFVWAYGLGAGDGAAFAIICILSGIALGGDLTFLPAMLADVVSAQQRSGGLEFGVWNFISKFTLALAAGIALPVLSYLGYHAGSTSGQGMHALSFSYALLPCLFKGAALGLLIFSPIDQPRRIP